MKAIIVTIGDELLLGQVLDTNSKFIARNLAALGIQTTQILSVADGEQAISDAIKAAMAQADIVFVTGGLGPTKDDITKKVLADYFKTKLVFNAKAFGWLKKILAHRALAMNEYNKTQAMLPQSCVPLQNNKGTASGMLFKHGKKVLISLPGVPFETEELMQTRVLPFLKKHYKQCLLRYKFVSVYNISESELAIKLNDFELSLPKGLGLAYLPSTDVIRLRLTAKDAALKHLTPYFKKLLKELNGLRFMEGEAAALEQSVADLFTSKKLTLAVAESCTGGNIAKAITALPGASQYFLGGVVAYNNEVKSKVLGVNPADIERHGAVSEEVACQMALGVLNLTGADYAVSTTGVAGPSGGTFKKPVGTVWIAVASKNMVTAQKFLFSTTRERNIGRSTAKALQMLLDEVKAK